jgi:hypothetical protein
MCSVNAALYWDQWNDDNPMANYVPNDKYIIATPWMGGMSNVRLSFELSCALAYCTNRTLVVPDLCYIDHLPAKKQMHDLRRFFDFNDLGISVMTLSEFCNKEHMSDVSEITPSFSPRNFDTCHNFIDLCNGTGLNPPCFAKRTAVTLDHDSKYVRFDKCLLGSFYSMLRHSNEHEANIVKRYVRKHVHYRSEIFESAMKVVQWLKRQHGEYYAMHVRRGDFLHCNYKTTCISMEDVMKNIEPHAPMQACIYIATDSDDASEFRVVKTKYTVVTLSDVMTMLNEDTDPVFHGIVEQIVCSQGVKFFSHPLSTFSNYVHRLRGYVSAADAFCHQTTSIEKKRSTLDSDWDCASNVWSKEFSDGFSPCMELLNKSI